MTKSRPREAQPLAQGHTANAVLRLRLNQSRLASSATSLLRSPPSGRLPRGLTRIVSTRLCTLAGSSTDGSGRMSTLRGTLCTAVIQPEWMLPPCAPPLCPAPSGAPRPAPALPRAPPARRPIAQPQPPPPARCRYAPPPLRSLTPVGPYHSARAAGGAAAQSLSPLPHSGLAHPRAPLWDLRSVLPALRDACGAPALRWGAPRRLPSAARRPGSGSARGG